MVKMMVTDYIISGILEWICAHTRSFLGIHNSNGRQDDNSGKLMEGDCPAGELIRAMKEVDF